MYLKDIIRGGISMKKLYLFIIPIISYILADIITGLEDQIPLYPESVIKIYILKYIFIILLGLFICFFSKRLPFILKHNMTIILCLLSIFLPIILWIYLIRTNFVGNFDNYFLVFFLYLGGYLNTIISHFTKKGDA